MEWDYRICPNYCTYPFKHTVKQFRSLQITANILFVYNFTKAYIVGTPSISTQNICFYKDNQKKKKKHKNIIFASLEKSFAGCFLSVPLVSVDTYFTAAFPSNTPVICIHCPASYGDGRGQRLSQNQSPAKATALWGQMKSNSPAIFPHPQGT